MGYIKRGKELYTKFFKFHCIQPAELLETLIFFNFNKKICRIQLPRLQQNIIIFIILYRNIHICDIQLAELQEKSFFFNKLQV